MQRALFAAFTDLPPSGQIHDRSDNKPARYVFCSRAEKVASCYARCARSLRRLERIALRSTSIFKGGISPSPWSWDTTPRSQVCLTAGEKTTTLLLARLGTARRSRHRRGDSVAQSSCGGERTLFIVCGSSVFVARPTISSQRKMLAARQMCFATRPKIFGSAQNVGGASDVFCDASDNFVSTINVGGA
jgi:hypothetical protein